MIDSSKRDSGQVEQVTLADSFEGPVVIEEPTQRRLSVWFFALFAGLTVVLYILQAVYDVGYRHGWGDRSQERDSAKVIRQIQEAKRKGE